MSDASPRKKIVLLGSTGSIGRNTLDVVRHYAGHFEVVALAAHSNADLLADQVREFNPRYVAMANPAAADRLRTLCPGVHIGAGPESLEHAASLDTDVVLCAIVGAAGLPPLLAAIATGGRVAVANKEPLVMAGHLVMQRAREHGAEVLPVDSEHNAIFQCMHGHDTASVSRIHLTASGGPFYGQPRASLARITPEEATRHPTWDMGAKISVDSATLMNKGLEIIEAMWLFGLPESRIDVVIHPQSVVHSMVEFRDGHILAHLGVTDMKFPILFALTYPERVEYPMNRLDLTALANLSFAAPDFSEFPCLALARDAAAESGTAPAILNAANEVAVAAFCRGGLPFLRISDVVAQSRAACGAAQSFDLDAVLEADAMARRKAEELARKLGSD